jgi:hypothetical protein
MLSKDLSSSQSPKKQSSYNGDQREIWYILKTLKGDLFGNYISPNYCTLSPKTSIRKLLEAVLEEASGRGILTQCI